MALQKQFAEREIIYCIHLYEPRPELITTLPVTYGTIKPVLNFSTASACQRFTATRGKNVSLWEKCECHTSCSHRDATWGILSRRGVIRPLDHIPLHSDALKYFPRSHWWAWCSDFCWCSSTHDNDMAGMFLEVVKNSINDLKRRHNTLKRPREHNKKREQSCEREDEVPFLVFTD